MAGENRLTTRRAVLHGLGAAVAASALPACATLGGREADALAALETRAGGRLGVAILDTASGRSTGHRSDERFGLCSTFKLPLAAVILADIDAGRLRADQFVRYGRADMVAHAPVTTKHLDQGGMTVIDLAEAGQVTSDNVAANLLIRLIGGPDAFTQRLRAIGDPVTRLDRYEPALNLVLPGEVNDTTTPLAMARLLAGMLTGNVLSPASRERLLGWMVATQTGARRIRAGLPAAWRAGDKTGTASDDRGRMVNKYNDVAIVWPPGRPPLIVTAYYDGPGVFGTTRPEDEAVLAQVGMIAARS